MARQRSPFLAILVLCLEAVLHVAVAPEVGAEEDVRDAVATLATEDACEQGSGSEDPQCSLSLRQLRGEMQKVSVDRHEAAASTDAKEQQASVAEVSGNTSEEQAPTFNYNWYFGDGSNNEQPPVTTDVTQTAGANGQPVFNYNWHFNFGMDDKDVKKGDCKTFGCTSTFDIAKLSDSCQCYAGCDTSPFGNVCCSDYQQTCINHQGPQSSWGGANPSNSWQKSDRYYFTFTNSFCHNGHGADELGKPYWVSDKADCRTKCTRDPRCRGFVLFGLDHYCILLSRVDITKCEKRSDYFTAMKNDQKNWGRGGSRRQKRTGSTLHSEPTAPGQPSPGYHPEPSQPSWGHQSTPGAPSLWPWMR